MGSLFFKSLLASCKGRVSTYEFLKSGGKSREATMPSPYLCSNRVLTPGINNNLRLECSNNFYPGFHQLIQMSAANIFNKMEHIIWDFTPLSYDPNQCLEIC